MPFTRNWGLSEGAEKLLDKWRTKRHSMLEWIFATLNCTQKDRQDLTVKAVFSFLITQIAPAPPPPPLLWGNTSRLWFAQGGFLLQGLLR